MSENKQAPQQTAAGDQQDGFSMSTEDIIQELGQKEFERILIQAELKKLKKENNNLLSRLQEAEQKIEKLTTSSPAPKGKGK